MKRRLFAIYEYILKFEFFIAYILTQKNRQKEYTLILDVVKCSKGSFGDEALISGMVAAEQEINDKVVVCEYPDNEGRKWSFDKDIRLETVKYMGFPYKLLKLMSKAEKVIVIGADIIDGVYGNRIVLWDFLVALYAKKLGAKTAISSFSFSKNASDFAKKYFRKYRDLIAYNCRDAYSSERLSNIIRGEVNVYPDIANYLKPLFTEKTDAVLKSFHEGSKPIVGININSRPFITTQKQYLYNTWERLIISLSKEYKVVFIIHDRRTDIQDIEEMKKSAKLKDVEVIDTLMSAAETKEVISELDYLITGKVHAGVAALSSGTPVAILDYNNKTEGMLKWYGLGSEYAFSKNEALSYNELYSHLHTLIEERKREKETILLHRQEVREMAKKHTCCK